MTELHITEDLKFQRLCLWGGVDVPSSIVALSFCLHCTVRPAIHTPTPLGVIKVASWNFRLHGPFSEGDLSDPRAFEQC